MDGQKKQQLTNRLKRIEGQVRGLARMLEDDSYCIDVINQSSAIRNSLASFEEHMLENHLTTHVVSQMKGGEQEKATEEILATFRRARKK